MSPERMPLSTEQMAKKREGARGMGGGPADCVCESWRVCVSRATERRTERLAPL